MTIKEAIDFAENLKPSVYDSSDLIHWLSQLDFKIKREIIDKHEGASDVTFVGYNEETAEDTVLLAPTPYDEMYVHWIHAQINFYNGEFVRYQASMAMHNAAYASYAAWYNETHMPIQHKKTYFGRKY